PACGEGPLYTGLLTVREHCTRCGADLSRHDSGDGAAAFVILILGGLMVGLGVLVQSLFAPPFWVHALLWPPLVLGGAVVLTRPAKALLIALQYQHGAGPHAPG